MNPIFENLEPEQLDELVHEAKGEEAAGINNSGLEDQIDYLIGHYGTEAELIGILKELEIL